MFSFFYYYKIVSKTVKIRKWASVSKYLTLCAKQTTCCTMWFIDRAQKGVLTILGKNKILSKSILFHDFTCYGWHCVSRQCVSVVRLLLVKQIMVLPINVNDKPCIQPLTVRLDLLSQMYKSLWYGRPFFEVIGLVPMSEPSIWSSMFTRDRVQLWVHMPIYMVNVWK